MAVDYNDTTQPAKFLISSSVKSTEVTIAAPVGELLQPNTVTEGDFIKLKGESKYSQIAQNRCTLAWLSDK